MSIKQKTINKIYHNPEYQGKHVIVIGEKTYTAKTGKGKTDLLRKLMQKYPRTKPLITYVPKADTLILMQCE